jgi:hypothetical protein
MADTDNPKASRNWIRRYPPLIVFAVALVIMLVIMPSALNLPQSNPTTVLEYAPVPPDDDEPPPPQDGSLSTLSLGTSDTIETGALPDEGPKVKLGSGDKPIVKRCVGDPARQTEDPNSPPCVPFFTGDNGGATFRGVTKDEINVAVYRDAHITEGGDDGAEDSPPSGEICDIDSAPNDPDNVGCINGTGTAEHSDNVVVRALARYFNDRFQTYNRHVHFYVYWSAAGGPVGRRSDVQDMYERIKPFAAIDWTIFGDTEPFIEAAVKRQISIYASYASVPNATYRQNAPYMWSFWPDVEHAVGLYVDYVCKRVAPFKVSHSGNTADQGKPRKYGLLSTSDAGYKGNRFFAELATKKLKQGCPNGARLDIVGEYNYPRNGWSTDTHPDAISAARENIATMQADQVTTILWLTGYETEHSKAADSANWYPEWVLAGDAFNDQIEENSYQNDRAWAHAWTLSSQLREDKTAEVPCRQAYREGDPFGGQADELSACGLYRSFFMLFRGIQVAGPFLTPDAVDEGNHSISRTESTNPYIASCFYDPGDFTCVKDAQESYWDADEPNPNDDPSIDGCWRMTKLGERHLAGTWKEGDDVFATGANDPCNSVTDNGTAINPYGPAG